MKYFLSALLSCGLLGVVLFTPSAYGAERLRLRYGPLERSLPVSTLSDFVNTGKPDMELSLYLRLAKQSPETFRKGLSFDMPADPATLDRVLNNPLGEALLSEMSEYIHASQQEVNNKALRSAFISSAATDGKVSLIEILENYPTPDITVEGDKLLKTYGKISRLVERGQALLRPLRS